MSAQKCDIAIVGGGPAGLAAGLYGARGLVSTIIFEKQASGGQITTTSWVENYPAFPDGVSGTDLGELMARQAEKYSAQIELFVTVTGIERADGGGFVLRTDSGTDWHARAVILACGAVPRRLDIPGETKYTGRGLSWCATCDANFFKDKVVAAIGGGDTAVEEAMYLTKFASKVYLIHRRDEFRAAPIAVERARKNEKIEFVLDTVPVEILGDGTRVTGLRVKSIANDAERTIDVSGIFQFVGVEPLNELVTNLADVTNNAGYIVVEDDGSIPAIPGLFAAGDLTNNSLKQVVSAAGSGATAAAAALKYLDESE